MWNNSKNIFFAVSIIIFGLLVACDGEKWPESGKSDILKMIQKKNFAFDCYPSKWVKENKERLKGLVHLGYLGTNQECQFREEDILWREFPEAVSATLRCTIDEITGEYTISVFPAKHTRYGDYYCVSAHFPSAETHELGAVTHTLEKPY